MCLDSHPTPEENRAFLSLTNYFVLVKLFNDLYVLGAEIRKYRYLVRLKLEINTGRQLQYKEKQNDQFSVKSLSYHKFTSAGKYKI